MSYKTSVQLEDWQNIVINEIAREENISTEQIILDAINAFLQKKLELKQDVLRMIDKDDDYLSNYI